MTNIPYEYFKTSESILMSCQYAIFLKNGVIDIVYKEEFARNLKGGFEQIHVRKVAIVSDIIEDTFNPFAQEDRDKILKEALYHLGKKDVNSFKKLYNILFENNMHQFQIAEQVLKEILREYDSMLDLPF